MNLLLAVDYYLITISLIVHRGSAYDNPRDLSELNKLSFEIVRERENLNYLYLI